MNNISPVTVPSVFYFSLIILLINVFFVIYTSKAETTFSSKKTFVSSSSAWNTNRFLKIVWYGRVFRVDIFAFRYIVKLSNRRDANLWRSRNPPPSLIEFANTTPLPSPSNFAEKRGSIYQGLQVVEYSSNQTLAYIGVTKKKLSSICLQRTTPITQENEARNRNTSKRSQMILEFWNIWSLNLSFLWATDPNFLLFGGFWSPGRVGIYKNVVSTCRRII